MTTSTISRPRLSAGLIVLLSIITLANVLVVALTIMTVADQTSHGASLGGGEVARLITFLVLAAAALAGIGGAWLRHLWGARLYLGTQLIAFVITLADQTVGPLTFVPLVLAGVLCVLVQRDR